MGGTMIVVIGVDSISPETRPAMIRKNRLTIKGWILSTKINRVRVD
jgi:hypothetical protein